MSDYDFAPGHKPPPLRPTHPPKPAETSPAPAASTKRTCPHCGFQYEGRLKANCRNCGAPQDVPVDNFQFAHPSFTRATALGLTLLGPAILGHIVGSVLRWTFPAVPAYKGVVHLASALLMLLAIILCTFKEPGPHAPPAPLRHWLRLTALAAAVCWIILCILALNRHDTRDDVRPFVLPALFFQTLLAALLTFHFSRMAMRIPDDSLATQAHYAGWACAAACLLLLVIQSLDLVTKYHLMIFTCSFPLIAGVVAICLWSTLILLRMARDLRAAARAGETFQARRQAL